MKERLHRVVVRWKLTERHRVAEHRGIERSCLAWHPGFDVDADFQRTEAITGTAGATSGSFTEAIFDVAGTPVVGDEWFINLNIAGTEDRLSYTVESSMTTAQVLTELVALIDALD